MNNISDHSVVYYAAPIEIALLYRCFFEAGGQGIPGLTPSLKITGESGNNMSLLEGTNWLWFERGNIPGDYEIFIRVYNFTILGMQYTIEIDSQDPGAGKLVTHFTYKDVYGRVTDASPTTTSFLTDLPSTTLDFYKDSYLLPLSGNNLGCGPKKVTGYSTGKVITVNALPVVPLQGDIFKLIRF